LVAIVPGVRRAVGRWWRDLVLRSGKIDRIYSRFVKIQVRASPFYLNRPNSYVDMYDDPASRHWLKPITGSPRSEPGIPHDVEFMIAHDVE
jgi:hypothetical protein